MNLIKSKKETNPEQKEQLKNFFQGSDLEKNIQKNNLNPEQIKIDQQPEKEAETKPQYKFSSIKKTVDEIIPTVNNVNITNYYNTQSSEKNNFLDKKFNLNSNFLSNSNFTEKNVNNKSFDFKNTFVPSDNILNEIKEKFYNTQQYNENKNNSSSIENTNTRNIIKSIVKIPALAEGGEVKEPMVGYLHENEAVVPLPKSEQFKNVINMMTEQIDMQIEKNETNKSITEIKDARANNIKLMEQQNQFIENPREKQKKIKESQEQPQQIVINQGGGGESPGGMDDGNIGNAYVGSLSSYKFFEQTYKIPEWRTKIG